MATCVSNLVNSVKGSCSQHRAKYVESVVSYFDSDLTMRQIAKEVGCSYQCVRDIMMLLPNYESRYFRLRSKGREGTSYRFAEDNPMWCGGLTNHASGYIQHKTPDWYEHTSAKKPKYVMEHVLIMCFELGSPNLGTWVVHHKNECKHDNRLSNLVLMQKDDHIALHTMLRKGVTTIPLRKYVQVNGSARLWCFGAPDEDIVYSSQRWLAA